MAHITSLQHPFGIEIVVAWIVAQFSFTGEERYEVVDYKIVEPLIKPVGLESLV